MSTLLEIQTPIETTVATGVAKDAFRSRIHPDWCPECGDFSVLSALQTALFELGLLPHQCPQSRMREGRVPDTGAGRRCDREEGPIVPQHAWFRVRPVLTALTALCAGAALASGAFVQAAEPAPKAGPDAASVKASIDAFASEWMDRMQRVEDDNRRSPKVDAGSTSYRGYGNDFRIEIKPTGYAPSALRRRPPLRGADVRLQRPRRHAVPDGVAHAGDRAVPLPGRPLDLLPSRS